MNKPHGYDYEVETVRRIYNNDTGSYIEISEDADCREFAVIRRFDETGKLQTEVTLYDGEIDIVIDCLQRFQVEVNAKKG